MTTFAELRDIIELSFDDHASAKHMRGIQKIMRKYKVLRDPTPERAVAALQELGPTFVKIGQIASNRSDMLPQEYCEAFASLRANVTPMPFEQVLQRIDESYGHSWQDTFDSIDAQPLGSASIAQVHRAVLKDGSVVAVKVRRPGIVQTMTEDIVLMRKIIALAEFMTPANQLLKSAGGLIDELERTTREELDFRVELKNLVKFRESMEKQEGVTSPIPYPECSTQEVLVMEYVEGDAIGKYEALEEKKYDLHQIGMRLANSYVTQVIDDGFFHADPHPGNAIVRNGEIVWIDLGMVGRLNPGQRSLVGRMFSAIATSNAYQLKETLLLLTKADKGLDHGALLSDLECLVARYGTASGDDLDIGQAMIDVVDLLQSYGIALPSALTMLARGFLTVEGAVSALTADINFVGILSEHIESRMLDVDSAMSKTKEMLAVTIASAEAAARLPRQAANTLDMIQKGQTKVNMGVSLSNNTLATTYTLVGNVCLSLIAAALYIGSAMLCTSDMGGPELLQVPALGVAGFAGAFVLSVYVIVRTINTRHRLKNDLKLR